MKLFKSTPLRQPRFLPVTRREMDKLGWDELDVLLISGDAYVDHPTFGMALIGRMLVEHGFRTGIIAQPRWNSTKDISGMGRPRLYAGITAGAIDSLLAHYTAFRKKRSDDAYTPGGRAGARPNRACIVYANLVRQAFPGLPVVLGGIEASLRRICHYDFWTDKLRRSILLDAKADMLIYGMGERASVEAAVRLDANHPDGLKGVGGTAFLGKSQDIPENAQVLTLPGHEEILADPSQLMQATLLLEGHVHKGREWAVHNVGKGKVILAPPAPFLSTRELDALYALPFTRKSHPSYDKPVPAQEMIQDSITSHRGCGGGCTFCSLALHQGRKIRSRSTKSILDETKRIAALPGFRGSITDVGGPSANMWQARCTREKGECKRSSCMVPNICKHFKVDQGANLKLLRQVRDTKGIKHLRVASGVRYDLALKEPRILSSYLAEFVGGQLKIAPEHICDETLRLMRKPKSSVFEEFMSVFTRESKKAGKEQYVIPYLISAFPGTTDDDMRHLAGWLKKRGWRPKQVQCFVPTPGTVATAMFFTGHDPEGNPIHVARSDAERLRQHHILIPAQRGKGRKSGQRGRKKKPSRKPSENKS